MAFSIGPTSSTSGNNVTSLTWSHTVSGSEPLLVVGESSEVNSAVPNDAIVTGITFNSVALTKIDSDLASGGGNTDRSELWYLKNPTPATANIVISYTGTNGGAVGMAVTVNGMADRVLEASAKANNASSTAETASVTTLSNNAFVIAVGMNGSAGNSFTLNTGTELLNISDAGGSLDAGLAYNSPTIPASSTIAWTLGGASRWAEVIASFTIAYTQKPLTSGSATASSAPATASVTPGSNSLVTLSVESSVNGATPNLPTATGNGLTWVAINNQVFGAASDWRVTIFRALGASPSAGAITIDFGGQSQDCIAWSVSEWLGVDTGGTNGSSAVVQSAKGLGTTQTLLATLAAFSNVNNFTFGAGGGGDIFSQNLTPGSGFLEIHEVDVAGTFKRVTLATEWKASNDTTVDMTWPTFAVDWGIVAIEIAKAGGAAAVKSVSTMMMMGV